jgi:two-component system, OmpR family, sensor histidine kinase VicK
MKSNQAVSDTEYVSWSNVADDMQNLSFVHSNEPEIVEQHRYLFESLLSKALPAELKIREIEKGIEHEKTEVIIGAENVANVTFPYFANADKIDICLDSDGPTLAMQVEAYRKLYSDFKESGRKIRSITEITKDNLVDCKELMKRAEVRHLDAIRGNFTTSHKEYLATSIIRGIQSIPLLIYSNFPEIVAQNQYLFDTLWNKAIPAEQRIREIEEGIPVERTEVISDPHVTENLYKSIVGEAEQEIMLILPTVNAFARQKRIGIIDFLKKLGEKGVKIRMLIPAADKENRINEQDITDLEACGIQVNQLSVRTPQEAEGEEGTKVSAVIVDKRTSLVIELKNDDEKEESFAGAIGSAAVHSTGKALASSYARIFESLWQETRLATQLKESEEMQREFINIAAHELRTPIQPILGASELMKFEFEKGGSEKVEVTKEDIEIIIRNAGRLDRLSSDILELARIGSGGRLNLHKSRFNIGEIMSKAMIDAKAQIVNEDKRNIKLHYDESNEDTVFVVYADKGRISQVVNNLLSNAIKFTHKGGGDIYLMTKKDRDNNNNNSLVIVTVKDTGTGIDLEIMPRLFTKFATKSAKGTGLGLYLSKNIIEAHGGKIWAENNNNSQGNGATFTFVLPLAEEEEELRR